MIAMTLPLNLQTNKVTFILRAPTLQFVVRTDAKTRAVHKIGTCLMIKREVFWTENCLRLSGV